MAQPSLLHRPSNLVLMGVSGSGKSTVGAALAASHGWRFIDGDDLHPPQNVARMAAGLPLSDADRQPWLERIARLLQHETPPLVIACSALRRRYRDLLRAADPQLRFVFLHGSAALLERRLQARSGHFMPAGLLQSQLDTLEAPGADEPDVLAIDLALPLAQQLAAIDSALARA